MRNSRFITSVLILLATFTILVASLSVVQNRMNAIRISERLTDTEPLENAPPVVAFTTVALGGFRGLIADWLWLRSQKMQDNGNYFEMVQLAEWITMLQPRFTAASAFLAWNMSYNISVTFHRPEDRWRWVRRGIELIRDEALAYNPSDPELFQQLGWIYQHKLGKDLDDANRYYKTQFAWEMIKVFGPVANRWDIISQGALTPAKLEDQIGSEKYDEFAKLLALKAMTFEDFERQFRERGRISEEIGKKLQEMGIISQVDICLRHRWLRNKYRLQPEIIAQITNLLGPLDWRLPEAHAIYWAIRGRNEWSKDEDKFKRLQCDRMIFQSLNAAFQGGSLVFFNADNTTYLEMRPNLNVVDTTRDAYASSMDMHGKGTIRGAFQNFMVDAVVYLYKFGNRPKALAYFNDAKKRFTDSSRFRGKDLDTFALNELEEDTKVMSYNQGQSTVQGYLVQMCYALATSRDEEAVAYERIAGKVHQKYMKDIGDSTRRRRELPPYPAMKKNTIDYCLQTFPAQLKANLKSIIEQQEAEAAEEKNE